jgi:hypothetical protein
MTSAVMPLTLIDLQDVCILRPPDGPGQGLWIMRAPFWARRPADQLPTEQESAGAVKTTWKPFKTTLMTQADSLAACPNMAAAGKTALLSPAGTTRAVIPNAVHVARQMDTSIWSLQDIPITLDPSVLPYDDLRAALVPLLRGTSILEKANFDIHVSPETGDSIPLIVQWKRIMFPDPRVFHRVARPGTSDLRTKVLHTLAQVPVVRADPELLAAVEDNDWDLVVGLATWSNHLSSVIWPVNDGTWTFVGRGGGGCVINDPVAEGRVVKLFRNVQYAVDEQEAANDVRVIDPEGVFSIVVDGYPKTLSINVSRDNVTRDCVWPAPSFPDTMPIWGLGMPKGASTLLNSAKEKQHVTVLMQRLWPLFFGLLQMTARNYPHHDIKPGNIVLVKEVNLFKYIDFGIAGMKEFVKTHNKLASPYIHWAPEYYATHFRFGTDPATAYESKESVLLEYRTALARFYESWPTIWTTVPGGRGLQKIWPESYEEFADNVLSACSVVHDLAGEDEEMEQFELRLAKAGDVWGLGLALLQWLQDSPMAPGPRELVFDIFQSGMMDIVRSMIRTKFTERPTAHALWTAFNQLRTRVDEYEPAPAAPTASTPGPA